MTKLDILRLDSTTENDTAATLNINTNFENIQKAIENTLSRDGTAPNYMDADLDMNSYRIINVGEAVNDTDAVSYKQFKEEIGEAVASASSAAASAAQAATSAQSALVSATNAISAVRNAESTLELTNNLFTETQQYVDNAKVDINNVVETGKQDINSTIDDASMRLSDTIEESVEEVKTAALEAAQGAINDAAAEATAIVIDYANNEIKPLLNEIASNAAESAENASESAGLAASESGNAAISATDSQHYAEDSRIWAEGSDSEVKNVDGEHSSKVWSEMAKTSAASASSSAELAKQYGNDKLNQTHITNCITEIPQDIKLELKDGTLTLKAGSKVYVPNGKNADGSLKFDEVVIANDISSTETGYTTITNRAVYVDIKNQKLICYANGGSGNSPSYSSGNLMYYRTDNNVMENYTGGSLASTGIVSLPILQVSNNESQLYGTITQIFDWCGYIGSTAFVLPGVKGLIPNGRNADGSLKNIEVALSSVKTFTSTITGMSSFVINESGVYSAFNNIYDEKLNENSSGLNCLAGTYTASSGVITSFQPKLPFRAADMNDVNTRISELEAKHQVVTSRPSSPTAGVFYFVKE